MDTVEPRFRLEPLTAQHAISQFQCEDDELTSYLLQDALRDIERHEANVFVEIDITCPAATNVAGYFALRAHSVRIEESYFSDWEPGDDAGANYAEVVEVPLVELMWIARDLRWQRTGMGEILLFETILQVAEAAKRIGFIGLYLRATDDSLRFFKQYSFFQPFSEHPHYDGHYLILPTEILNNLAAGLKGI